MAPATVKNESKPNRMLTEREAAQYLGVSPGTLGVWRCTQRYDVPFYRLGNKAIRYKQSDLDNWLDSQRVTSS